MSKRFTFKRERSTTLNNSPFLEAAGQKSPKRSNSSSSDKENNTALDNTSMMHLLQPRPMVMIALNNKGVAYIEKRQYTQAKKSLSRALRIAEKNAARTSATSDSNASNKTSLREITWPLVHKELASLSLMSASSVESSDTSKTPFKHRAEYDEGEL